MKFDQKIYSLVKKIPKGKVTTYSEIAKALHTKAYRAVGQALERNNDPNKIPCYRVIKSDGSIGGYCGSNIKNIKKKMKKLRADGIEIINNKIPSKYIFRFKS